VSADSDVSDQRAGVVGRRPSRAWAIVGALSITETVSWGILYYAFAVFLLPMQRELGFSTPQLTGAFSLALLISAVAGVGAGRYWRSRPGVCPDARIGCWPAQWLSWWSFSICPRPCSSRRFRSELPRRPVRPAVRRTRS
jgi:hypothetical protein